MKYFLAGLFSVLCLIFMILIGWSNDISKSHNIIIGVVIYAVLGFLYWVPFWMIFM